MKYISVICGVAMLFGALSCNKTDTQSDGSDSDSISSHPADTTAISSSTPRITLTDSAGDGFTTKNSESAFNTDLQMPAYQPGSSIPGSIEIGMPVSLAMQIPGVKQTVSAIMTGGKITGTVVLQFKGKSYYTNVDFAEEGCYAFGTRCQTPEQISAFIELACSEALTATDFSPEAIVTESVSP